MKKLIEVLDAFNFSSLYDYDNKGDYISMLGILENNVVLLDCFLPKGWVIVERKRNSKNNFLKVDIVKSK